VRVFWDDLDNVADPVYAVLICDIIVYMTKPQKTALFLLRIALGFLFLYAGISKIADPAWTSAGYLKGTQLLTGYYQWLGAPQNIVWVDFLNEWGLFLIGAALVFGLATRVASLFAIWMMALYYIPILKFPYAGHGYIVDEHIIYIAGFIVLIAFNAGAHWGLDGMIERSKKIPASWKKCLLCK
jgi:thiosulfate dehydrogenase [quinone] large subunit